MICCSGSITNNYDPIILSEVYNSTTFTVVKTPERLACVCAECKCPTTH